MKCKCEKNCTSTTRDPLKGPDLHELMPQQGRDDHLSLFRQAHILAALKAWCHWLAKLHTVSLKHSSYEPQCRELTSRITISATAILREENTPAPLVHSAAHFLSTLTGTVRPPSIWKLKEFTELYTCVEQLRFPSEEDRKLVVRALANVLLLHWPGLSEQRWEERQKHLSKFLRDITAQFRLVRAAEGFQTSREMQVQGTEEVPVWQGCMQ